jgi:hypothetical protein
MASRWNIISKIGTFMAVALAVVAIAAYFIFGLKSMINYYSVIIAAALVFILSFATMLIYKIISEKDSSTASKYIFITFAGKLVIIALVFFLFVKTFHMNLIYFFISFVVFFTILLNIEIFLLYKKILFKK